MVQQDEQPDRPAAATATAHRNYVTWEQLIAQTGLSAATLQRYKRAGKIPFFQPGGPGARVLFPPDAIEAAARLSHEHHQAPAGTPGTAASDPTGRQAGQTPGGPRLP